MTTPERIHVNWDAANAYDYLKYSVNFISPRGMSEEVVPAIIENVLAEQAQKFFTLLGHAAGVALYLKVDDYDENTGLTISNRFEPLFTDIFRVADEPMPHVAYPHGDVVFDLVKQGEPED